MKNPLSNPRHRSNFRKATFICLLFLNKIINLKPNRCNCPNSALARDVWRALYWNHTSSHLSMARRKAIFKCSNKLEILLFTKKKRIKDSDIENQTWYSPGCLISFSSLSLRHCFAKAHQTAVLLPMWPPDGWQSGCLFGIRLLRPATRSRQHSSVPRKQGNKKLGHPGHPHLLKIESYKRQKTKRPKHHGIVLYKTWVTAAWLHQTLFFSRPVHSNRGTAKLEKIRKEAQRAASFCQVVLQEVPLTFHQSSEW